MGLYQSHEQSRQRAEPGFHVLIWWGTTLPILFPFWRLTRIARTWMLASEAVIFWDQLTPLWTSPPNSASMTPRSLLSLFSLVAQSCPTLVTPWTVACQAPLSMGCSRQEYWSGLPFPSPGDLPNPGIEPRSPALQADSLPTRLWGN